MRLLFHDLRHLGRYIPDVYGRRDLDRVFPACDLYDLALNTCLRVRDLYDLHDLHIFRLV